MDKDTQNVILVFLSIIVVIVVVLGGGYWYLNYGDGAFMTSAAKNKTIVPKKKASVEPGEYAITLEDDKIKEYVGNISEYETDDIKTLSHISKPAYARNIVTATSNSYDIYVYYIFKEVVDVEGVATIKYYTDAEMTNLIIESVEDLDATIFDTASDTCGLYAYSFISDKAGNITFDKVEKIR